MGFWDRIRRGGAQAPAAPAPSDTATAEPGPAAAPQAPAGRPGWDGGWREVAPPSVTIARSPLGVSDGLRFRSGLASWQNPTLTSELGHGLVPSAPAGLIHGVARPTGAPRTTTVEGGGPLLLRTVRPDAEPDPDAGADAGQATGPGTTSPDPGQAVQRLTGTTAPAAVPARSPGRPEAADPLVVPRSTGSGPAAAPGTPASSASPRRTTPAPEGAAKSGPTATAPVLGADSGATDALTVSRRTTDGGAGGGSAAVPPSGPGGAGPGHPLVVSRRTGSEPGAGPASEPPKPSGARAATGGPKGRGTYGNPGGPGNSGSSGAAKGPGAAGDASARTDSGTPNTSAARGASGTPNTSAARGDSGRPTASAAPDDSPSHSATSNNSATPGDSGTPGNSATAGRPGAPTILRRIAPVGPKRPGANGPVTLPLVGAGPDSSGGSAGTAVTEAVPRSPESSATPRTRPAPVRPRPVGTPLVVARRPATAPRVLTAVPTRASATTADRAPKASPEGTSVREEPAPAARPDRSPRTPARPGLGEPLTELPVTARRMDPAKATDATNTTTPAPARAGEAAPPLTVMRRTTEAEGPTGGTPPQQGATTGPKPTTRSGLGAPLRELPPTATPAAPLLGGATPTARPDRWPPTSSPPTPAPGSSVQRDVANPGVPVAPRGTSVEPLVPVSRAAAGNTTDPAEAQGGSASAAGSAPVVPVAGPSETRPDPLVPVSRAVGSPTASAGSTPRPSVGSLSGPAAARTAAPAAPVGSTPRNSAPAAPAVQRSLRLLADRPLVVSTGVPEGFSAQPGPGQAAGPASRPVVAASWRREPVPDPETAPAPASAPRPTATSASVQRAGTAQRTPSAPPTGTAPRPAGSAGGPAPSPAPRGLLARLRSTTAAGFPNSPADHPISPVSPGAPTPVHAAPPAPVQRATRPEPVTPTAPATPAVPVVRLAPNPSDGRPDPGRTDAPVQRLAHPLTYTRGAVSGAVAEPPAPPVARAPAASQRLQAKAVQRMAEAGLSGVPVIPVARDVSSTSTATTTANTSTSTSTSTGTQTPPAAPRGKELDELARALIDPVARLLRAEMRRGRERTGRPYDNRR
ncbi:hypothetical protein ABZ958_15695 [Streptomyces sp. NPDC046237]|uniref:hypothetical protein n=1 Tax=Streptomyces sp. NPDC046237 TaxID=3154914 RepID=UPI00340CBBBE